MDAQAFSNSQPGDEPEAVPLSDALRRIGWDPAAGYRAVRNGQFPLVVFRVGRRRFVSRRALDALLSGDSSQISEGQAGAA